MWQPGRGTQTNMNVNEVIANRAIQIMGGKMVLKNLFILMIMSINLNLPMCFPTAMHIAIALKSREKLLPSLKLLEKN